MPRRKERQVMSSWSAFALGVGLSNSPPHNASDLQAENNQDFFVQDWVHSKDAFREYYTERMNTERMNT